MILSDALIYLKAMAVPYKGIVSLIREGNHNKFKIEIPKKGMHIFAVSAHEKLHERKIKMHFDKAVKALHANAQSSA